MTVLLGAALVTLPGPSLGQRATNWRVYKMADGLPESACASVTVSPQGRVLTRHLNAAAASELDGYTITMLPAPEGTRRVYESPGGQLWTFGRGALQEYRERSWVTRTLQEVFGPATVARLTEPIALYPVRQGLVICLLPDRLVEFDFSVSGGTETTLLRKADQTQLERFTAMTAARDGGLWVAGARGLAKVPGPLRNLKGDTAWREYLPPVELQTQNLHGLCEDGGGGVSSVAESTTNHEELLTYFDSQSWSAWSAAGRKIQHFWRGPDGTWWACTPSTLYHSDGQEPDLVEDEELSARQYFDVTVEPGGQFWLATSDGLFRFAPLIWRSSGWGKAAASPIQNLAVDSQNQIWFVSASGLHVLEQGRHREFPFANAPVPGLPAAPGLFVLRNGDILLWGENRLFEFHPATGRFAAVRMSTELTQVRALGQLRNGKVALEIRSKPGDPSYTLESFDGSTFSPLPCPASDLGVGNHPSVLYEAQNGNLWLGAEGGTACYRENKWRTFGAADKTSPESPVAIAELADGKLWCATVDKVWQFDSRDWSEVRRGFDQIIGLIRTPQDGSIWVASQGGLDRYYQGAWVENGLEEGLPSLSIRALCQDQHGHLWVGTTHGLSLYQPEADRDPPEAQVRRFPESEQKISAGGAITMLFNGQDKWKLTPRERLLYSYRLDDRDWSPFQSASQATFTDLSAGKHYFQVRVMDRNCNVDPKPAQLEFAVVLPWYQETRLLAISLAGTVVALFFAGLAFNRHRQLARSYAEVEEQVTERTQELELASRELLHSQKMNALGTLAAGIAHDFNNILSIIKGSAQIMEENLDNPQKLRTRLDRIKTVVEQGSGIVKAMLGFSRESDQQQVPCDINSVVEDTIKLLGDRFLREVNVEFRPDPDLPAVACPKDLVQQVLLNFIFNAAESMDRNKRMFLSTKLLHRLESGLVLQPAGASAYAAINVQDFGCGIPAENMPLIFDPFFTTKARSDRRGTGLGLSMVYELAKKLEAGLAVASVVNHGSTFTVILPVRGPAAKSEIRRPEVKRMTS
jgi:signal transduction histidine kinase